MKKTVIFILLIFILPVLSAVEFDMKTEFNQGETLMAKVSGNFIDPVLEENVLFYRGHVRVSIDPEVTKIEDEFYISALLPETKNNYSIVIENVKYMKGSQISEDDIEKNFSITENTADFSINPGFVITEEDFFIEVQNLQDSKITIKIKTKTNSGGTEGFFSSLFGGVEDEEENSLTLKSGEIKKINFEVKNIKNSTFKTIELSTDNLKYEIPVYIFADEVEKEKKFKLEPAELPPVFMPTNENTTRILFLYNTGEETIENISLSVSSFLKPYVSLSTDKIDELEKDSNVKIELYFSSNSEEKLVEGQITAKTPEYLYTYSAVFLNFIKNYIPSDDGEINTDFIEKTCSELQGKKCGEDEECDQDLVYSKDDLCCLGECKKSGDSGGESSTGKIVGWAIIIVIVIFVIWFFKQKYFGQKRKVDLLKIAKGKK